MLDVNSLKKAYGGECVLNGVTFTVNSGEKVALVGPNGAGKSTLFKIIAGLESADNGNVKLDKKATVGYLPQHLTGFLAQTVHQFLLPERLWELESKIHRLEGQMEEMSEGKQLDKVMQQYSACQEEYRTLEGYEFENRIRRSLAGLGLSELKLDAPLSSLSGGQKAKVALAQALVMSPTLLLLDEPTNHLDLESLLWLEQFVQTFRGTVLIVSHDRRFLDRTVSRVLDLDDHSHKIKEYSGNYTEYAEQKEREIAKQYERYQDYKGEVKRIKDSARKKQEWANKGQRGGKAKDSHKLGRNAAKDRSASLGSAGKAMQKRLERLDVVEKPFEGAGLYTELDIQDRSGQLVAEMQDIHKSYDRREVLNGVSMTLHFGEHVALLGPNGSGKTTLLKILLGQVQPDTGKVKLGARVYPGYFAQEQESLEFSATVLEEFQKVARMSESEARTYLNRVEFTRDEVFKKIKDLSPGERARLIVAKLMVARPNLLVLDEPTNHLDLDSLKEFETAIAHYPGTILVVSHDRYFLDRIGISRILFLADGKISSWMGDYQDYEDSLVGRVEA